MRSRVLFIALGGIVAAACGLSATGQLEIGGGDGGLTPGLDGASTSDVGPANDDGSTGGDGGGDAELDAFDATPPCDAGIGSATYVVIPPDGVACPSGTMEQTVQTAPAPVAGACSCAACAVTTEASCAGANFQVRYAGDNSCGGGPLTYNVANNTCTDFNQGTFTVNDYHRWTARTPADGVCTSAGVTDPTKVTSTALKTCIATSSATACQTPPAGSRRCIESTGACGGEFSQTLVVGSAATVACAACGCTRIGTTCKVDYHGNSTCTDAVRYTINATGMCTQTNDATGVNHFKVYATGLSCNTTPGVATASLTSPKTLCCAP